MLANRQDLSEFLRSVLGEYGKNVYFQPPESLKLNFPCIIYELGSYSPTKADNKAYHINESYSITLVTKLPDTNYGKQILNKETAKFDRYFVNDNLYHYVFTITI